MSSETDILTHHALVGSNTAYSTPPHELSFGLTPPGPVARTRRSKAQMEADNEVEVASKTMGESMEESQEVIVAAAKNEGFSSPVRNEFAWALPSAPANPPQAPSSSPSLSAQSHKSLFPAKPTWAHFSPAPSGITISRRTTVTASDAGPSGSSAAPETPVQGSRKRKGQASGLGRVMELGGGAEQGKAGGRGKKARSDSVGSEDEVDELATPKAGSIQAGSDKAGNGSGLRKEVPLAYRALESTEVINSRNKAKARHGRSRFRSSRVTTHPSFYVSLLAGFLCATALVGFVLGLIEQARSSGNTRRWNIVIIVGVLAAIGFYSVVIIVGRIIAVRAVFRSMPKPYVPTKSIDVPKEVANHIMVEYTRTAVVAYLSQPTAGKQEGWGRPGTALANVHFRSRIRAMFPTLLQALDAHCTHPAADPPRVSDHPPTSPIHLISHPYLPSTARPFVQIFMKQLESARYARREPDEAEVEAGLKVVALILGILQATPPVEVDPPKEETKDGLFDGRSRVSSLRPRSFSVHAPPPLFASP